MGVYFIEDNEITSIALRTLIDETERLDYAGNSRTLEDALPALRSLEPAVVLLKFPVDGWRSAETIAAIAEVSPMSAIALFTTEKHAEAANEALMAGAKGIFLKGMRAQTLQLGLSALGEGAVWIERSVWHKIQPCLEEVEPIFNSVGDMFSPREKEIAHLVAAGYGNGEIAQMLGIGRETVKTHVSKLMRKTGARSRTQIAINAMKLSAAG